MKKFAIYTLVALATLGSVSCTKYYYDNEGYSGSYSSQEKIGTQRYMESVVRGYLADHLWVMEQALKYDASKIYQNIRTSAEYATDGNSLWRTGTVWTASEVTALKGITIEKMPEDSTWVLKRNDKAAFKSLPSYLTESEITLRMLPTPDDAPRHEWRLFVNELLRTEEFGYKADLSTIEAAEFRVARSTSSWAYCKGTFWMDVTKDDALVDKAVLSYDGDTNTALFYHNL